MALPTGWLPWKLQTHSVELANLCTQTVAAWTVNAQSQVQCLDSSNLGIMFEQPCCVLALMSTRQLLPAMQPLPRAPILVHTCICMLSRRSQAAGQRTELPCRWRWTCR